MQNSDGVIIVEFDKDEDLAEFYETKTINGCEFYNNQYVLIKHKEEIVDRYRHFDGKFIKVVKKKFKNVSVLPPLDDIQMCGYDSLFSQDIKIVILSGRAGTGKTRSALSVGMELLKQQVYDKILILRNPVFQGKEVGYSPGDKITKFIDGGFAGSIIDNLDGNKFEFEDLIRKELVEMDITSAIKGRNYKNTFIIVDEAQDLFPSTVLGIGTRINDSSCKLVFCSDLGQCASDKYLNNSGVQQLINKAKGQDWFSHIELQTNGRGEIASWFGDKYMS